MPPTTTATAAEDYNDLEPPKRISQREKDSLTTLAAVVATFSDFLIVATHTILYERDIYPAELFISTRKYSHPVKQNRHPKICKWIHDAVDACSQELLKGTVSRIAVVILSPQNQPLERFVFDVSSFPTTDLPRGPPPPLVKTDTPPSALANLEAQFRAAMRKISICSSGMAKLPQDSTFTMVVELKDTATVPENHIETWAPSERQSSSRAMKTHAPKHTPVRTIETAALNLELWIEEGSGREKAKKITVP